MSSKRCRICKQILDISQFYKNPVNKDGHNSVCRNCYKDYQNQHRHGICERCGVDMYKHSRNQRYCLDCRQVMKVHQFINPRDHDSCRGCKFLKTCRIRVFQTDQEHWDWMPPCFVTSRYHEQYLREYSDVAAAG